MCVYIKINIISSWHKQGGAGLVWHDISCLTVEVCSKVSRAPTSSGQPSQTGTLWLSEGECMCRTSGEALPLGAIEVEVFFLIAQ